MSRKHSSFVRQQKNNQRIRNKTTSNINHTINRSTKKIDKLSQDYNNFVNDTMEKFLKENGLEEVPRNSRILVYEILKKNLKTKIDQYKKAIAEIAIDTNNLKEQYQDAIKVCKLNLEQIDWIYNWTSVWQCCDSEKDEFDTISNEEALTGAANILIESKLKFDDITKIPEIIENCKIENFDKNRFNYNFYEFCRYILRLNKRNKLDMYHTYISGIIKNLMIIESDDPINKYTLNGFINNGGDTNNELSISTGD